MNCTMARRLNIEGAYNLRELGGYKNKEGKKLKYHKLLRSDHLHNITDKSAVYLRDYGLKTIVDFRSPDEYEKTPDKKFSNIEEVIIPVYETDKEEKPLSEKEMFEKLQTYPDGNAFLKESYVEMLHNPHAHSAYHKFFQILIEHNQEEEALLFHCASGKDRTGFAAALILLSLNFSKEVIIEDYLLSNQYVRDEAVRVSERIRKQGQPEAVVKAVYNMLMVQQSHIEYVFEEMENMYQDTDTYLEKVLGVGNTEREALAAVYLSSR